MSRLEIILCESAIGELRGTLQRAEAKKSERSERAYLEAGGMCWAGVEMAIDRLERLVQSAQAQEGAGHA